MSLTGSASVTKELQGGVESGDALHGKLNNLETIQGSVESGGEVRGKLSGLKTLRGYSAYEVAVINGFSGTEEEWLESLQGKDGVDGTLSFEELTDEQLERLRGPQGEQGESGVYVGSGDMPESYNVQIDPEGNGQSLEEMVIEVLGGTTAAKIGEVTLLASAWEGSGNLYSQVVSIDGVTERSQVDLTPSVEQLVVFYEKDLTFVTENEGGVVTVYAIGQKPTNDYTIQVTITEVSV